MWLALCNASLGTGPLHDSSLYTWPDLFSKCEGCRSTDWVPLRGRVRTRVSCQPAMPCVLAFCLRPAAVGILLKLICKQSHDTGHSAGCAASCTACIKLTKNSTIISHTHMEQIYGCSRLDWNLENSTKAHNKPKNKTRPLYCETKVYAPVEATS